ncbi:MAG: hypothetical protein PHE53_05165 [Thermoguttaceae bacterium]|nr:hypothetical protein [Thermoguttaceae bacterium]
MVKSKKRESSTRLSSTRLNSLSVEQLLQMASDRRAEYHRELEKLASNCVNAGLNSLAATIQRWIWRPDASEICVPILPDAVETMVLTQDQRTTSEQEQRATLYFFTLRKRYAADLEQIAKAMVRQGYPTLAMTLIFGAVRENPDDPQLRRVLGYQAFQGSWRTAWECGQIRAGRIDHPKFGWIPKNDVEHYEKGERFEDRRWLSAEEDAAAHQTMEHGRFVESEHFRVRTNASLEEGVQITRRLETLYRVWSQVFVSYSRTPDEIQRLFENRSTASKKRNAPKFQVALFRTRDDYIQTLRPNAPEIERSIGFYHGKTHHAYFFMDGGCDDSTVYHEAVHQLFTERKRVSTGIVPRQNFWITEAIACYFETLREDNGFLKLGGTDTPRLLAARIRLLEHHFYIPLAELSAMSCDAFQRYEYMPMLYTQVAGLAQFFFHGQDGIHREAFVKTLYEIYSVSDTTDSLSRHAGTSFQTLDEEYERYIQSLGVPKNLHLAP